MYLISIKPTFGKSFPNRWQDYLNLYQEKVELYTNEMFTFSLLDETFEHQSWICPIQLTASNRAYYSPSEDRIVLPLKAQFKESLSFYATALHEMIHSTGSDKRLNRIQGNFRDSLEYAKEKLTAELSAALLSYYMRIESCIRENHAAYLKDWVGQMKKDPHYLMDVLGEVIKAVSYICDQLQFDPFENEDIPTRLKEKTGELVIIE